MAVLVVMEEVGVAGEEGEEGEELSVRGVIGLSSLLVVGVEERGGVSSKESNLPTPPSDTSKLEPELNPALSFSFSFPSPSPPFSPTSVKGSKSVAKFVLAPPFLPARGE